MPTSVSQSCVLTCLVGVSTQTRRCGAVALRDLAANEQHRERMLTEGVAKTIVALLANVREVETLTLALAITRHMVRRSAVGVCMRVSPIATRGSQESLMCAPRP